MTKATELEALITAQCDKTANKAEVRNGSKGT